MRLLQGRGRDSLEVRVLVATISSASINEATLSRLHVGRVHRHRKDLDQEIVGTRVGHIDLDVFEHLRRSWPTVGDGSSSGRSVLRILLRRTPLVDRVVKPPKPFRRVSHERLDPFYMAESSGSGSRPRRRRTARRAMSRAMALSVMTKLALAARMLPFRSKTRSVRSSSVGICPNSWAR